MIFHLVAQVDPDLLFDIDLCWALYRADLRCEQGSYGFDVDSDVPLDPEEQHWADWYETELERCDLVTDWLTDAYLVSRS